MHSSIKKWIHITDREDIQSSVIFTEPHEPRVWIPTPRGLPIPSSRVRSRLPSPFGVLPPTRLLDHAVQRDKVAHASASRRPPDQYGELWCARGGVFYPTWICASTALPRPCLSHEGVGDSNQLIFSKERPQHQVGPGHAGIARVLQDSYQ